MNRNDESFVDTHNRSYLSNTPDKHFDLLPAPRPQDNRARQHQVSSSGKKEPSQDLNRSSSLSRGQHLDSRKTDQTKQLETDIQSLDKKIYSIIGELYDKYYDIPDPESFINNPLVDE